MREILSPAHSISAVCLNPLQNAMYLTRKTTCSSRGDINHIAWAWKGLHPSLVPGNFMAICSCGSLPSALPTGIPMAEEGCPWRWWHEQGSARVGYIRACCVLSTNIKIWKLLSFWAKTGLCYLACGSTWNSGTAPGDCCSEAAMDGFYPGTDRNGKACHLGGYVNLSPGFLQGPIILI